MHMFQSATLKLTAWYLMILMSISITFSVVIYQLNYQEVTNRLEDLQHSLVDDLGLSTPTYQDENYGSLTPFRYEAEKAGSQMVLSLIYINLVVLIAGGLGSYLLARRSLKPIEMAHEAQSRFTSDASHELRTPLAAMKAELEVTLRDKNLQISDAKEVMSSSLEEVDKLIKLSDMLLRLSRLEHDSLEYTKINLAELFDNVLATIPDGNKRFQVTSRQNPSVTANPTAMSELMTILTENALKYSPPKSKIQVRIFGKRGFIGFEIKNKGQSIPTDILPKIFDRFFRADSSRTNGYINGYGLGLSLAKKIVDVHHGEISALSDKDWTTFRFLIPVTRRSH